MIELEQGIVIDNENVLITNVTVHVVNPDEEGGILMRLVEKNVVTFDWMCEWESVYVKFFFN